MKKMKLVVIAAALVAAVSLSFVSCSNDTTTEEAGVTGIVSGYVYDSVTMKGVEGVTVTVAGHSATTNASGVYVVSGVEPTDGTEEYTVVFKKDNYIEDSSKKVSVDPQAYLKADPFGEKTLTDDYIKACGATTATNTTENTTASDNVSITYTTEALTVAMEKIAYEYGVTVDATPLIPLTSGITGTVYLDDFKGDEIDTTTTKAPKGAVVSFEYNGVELGSTTTDENGVFKFYGLPTGQDLATVKYTVDYTDTTTNKYYGAKGLALSTLANEATDTLSVNTKDDTATYFQAGNVFAYLTDAIYCTSDNFTGKILAVTDSVVLTFDHQLTQLKAYKDALFTKPYDVKIAEGTTAGTCTATIFPIAGTFVAGDKIYLTDAKTDKGTTTLKYTTASPTFAKLELVSMKVVDTSRAAVTSAQFLELEFNMEIGSVEGCTVGGKATDAVISGVYIDVPFNDTVNTNKDGITVTFTNITSKVSENVDFGRFDSTDYADTYFAEQSNYIASTNLNSYGELSYGADLVLTFAADFGTYTDIDIYDQNFDKTIYDSSYDSATKALTISRVDGTVMTDDSLTIAVMNGTTTVYTTANKNFGAKASEASLATTANKVCFTVLTKPTPDTYKSTTAKDFKKSLNSSIVLTFDVDVSSYKALLLTSSIDNTKDYDEVIADSAESIIASKTTASAKTLTVAPAGNYAYNTPVNVAYYTKDGDYVGKLENTYKLDVLDDYMTLLAAQTSTITASLSSKSVKDNAYTATFDFTPEYKYTKSGSTNTYQLYSRATNIRGIVGEWAEVTSASVDVDASDISIAKTATTSTTGTFGGNKSVDFLLVTTVDNLAKSYYYAGFADTTKPNFTSITNATYNKTDVKWELSSNPTVKGTTTYTVDASESIATVKVVATFAKATETAAIKHFATGDSSFTFDVVSSDIADAFTAADYVTITVTDYAGNSYTVPLYCK